MKRISKLTDLAPDPRNARRHPQRNLDQIANLLNKVGAARSIVIDEDGAVLAGNGVLAAASEAGISRVQVVDADGKTLVAVRRAGLSPRQKAELALGDNRANELSAWDVPTLTNLVDDLGINLADIGFTREELSALKGPETEEPSEPRTATIAESFQVVIECRDESEQQELFERMTGEGFKCRV